MMGDRYTDMGRRQFLQAAGGVVIGRDAVGYAAAGDAETYDREPIVVEHAPPEDAADLSDGELFDKLDGLTEYIQTTAQRYKPGSRAALYLGNVNKYTPWIEDAAFDGEIIDHYFGDKEAFREQAGGYAYTLNMALNEDVTIDVVGLDEGSLNHDRVYLASGVIESVMDEALPDGYDLDVNQEIVEPKDRQRQAIDNMINRNAGDGANTLRNQLDIDPLTAPVYVTDRFIGIGVGGFAEISASGASVLTTRPMNGMMDEDRRRPFFKSAAAMEPLHAVGQLPHSVYPDGAMTYNDPVDADYHIQPRSRKMLERVCDGQLTADGDVLRFEPGEVEDDDWVQDDFEDHVRAYLGSKLEFEDMEHWNTDYVKRTAADEETVHGDLDAIQFYRDGDDFDFRIAGTIDGYWRDFAAWGDPHGGSYPYP